MRKWQNLICFVILFSQTRKFKYLQNTASERKKEIQGNAMKVIACNIWSNPLVSCLHAPKYEKTTLQTPKNDEGWNGGGGGEI